MNRLISVIVPIYNSEDYIHKCVDSIISQDYDALDIILVDDGSKDSSSQICDEYAEKDSRVRVIHKPNGGLVSSRKAGVELANGDYITFVEGDDWLQPNTFNTIFSKVGTYDPDIITFGYIKRYENNTNTSIYEAMDEGYYTKEKIRAQIEAHYNDKKIAIDNITLPTIWCKLCKPEILKKNVQKVDNRMHMGEDMSTALPCFIEADSVYVLHEVLYNYRIRSTSISHTNSKNKAYVELTAQRFSDSLAENGVLENRAYQKMALSYCYHLMFSTDICCFFDSVTDLYPQLGSSDRVIIYGRGDYGYNIKELIEREAHHQIVGMFDMTNIDGIKNISSDDYDHIIIAIALAQSVAEVKENLFKYGVSENKILYLTNGNISKEMISEDVHGFELL